MILVKKNHYLCSVYINCIEHNDLNRLKKVVLTEGKAC